MFRACAANRKIVHGILLSKICFMIYPAIESRVLVNYMTGLPVVWEERPTPRRKEPAKPCTHLTEMDRYVINNLRIAGFSLRETGCCFGTNN